MPGKAGQSAKERKKLQKMLEAQAKESMQACAEGEAILDKINTEKGHGVGQYPKAVVHFTKAIEANPENSQAYVLRARCMKAMGENEKAIADYTRAIELNPRDTDSLAGRGHCYEQLQDWDKAINDYTSIIELLPEDDHAYNMRGNARSSKRLPGLRLKAVEFRQLIADFTKAVELNDCNFYAFANRGNAWFDRQEYRKAIQDYSRALFIKDDYWYVYLRRGVAYYECVLQDKNPPPVNPDLQLPEVKTEKTLEQQWEDEFWEEERQARLQEEQDAFLHQAINDFTVYIKHEEKEKGEPDPSALVHRAQTYLLLNSLDEALNDFKKAKEVDPALTTLVHPFIENIRTKTKVKAKVQGEG